MAGDDFDEPDLLSLVGRTRIDPEVLRGTPLSALVRNGGTVMRTSPVDLPSESCERLWNMSKKCNKLDLFISQSWSSPGWQKYLALLIRFYWAPAAVMGFFALIVCTVLDVCAYLPAVKQGTAERLGWDSKQGDLYLSAWSFLPPSVALVALLLAPSIPGLPTPTVFFDACCINQVNAELKKKGVYSLAGFVANSEELLLMWSRSYFRRAWCVLELAVCLVTKGQGAVRFCPLFNTTSRFVMFLLSLCFCTMICITDISNVANEASAVFLGLRAFAMVAFLSLGAHKLRLQMLQFRELARELDDFSMDAAECRVDSDFEFIKRSVEIMYGDVDKFNTFVRRELKLTITAAEKNFDFSYNQCLAMTFPFASYSVQQVAGFARSGISTPNLISAAAGHGALVFFIVPTTIKLSIWLCRLVPSWQGSTVVNIALSLGLGCIGALWGRGVLFLCVSATNNLHVGGLLCFGVSGLIACPFFIPVSCLHSVVACVRTVSKAGCGVREGNAPNGRRAGDIDV